MVYKASTPPSPLLPVGLVGNPKGQEAEGLLAITICIAYPPLDLLIMKI